MCQFQTWKSAKFNIKPVLWTQLLCEIRCNLNPKAQAVNKAQRQLKPESYFPESFKSRAQMNELQSINTNEFNQMSSKVITDNDNYNVLFFILFLIKPWKYHTKESISIMRCKIKKIYCLINQIWMPCKSVIICGKTLSII